MHLSVSDEIGRAAEIIVPMVIKWISNNIPVAHFAPDKREMEQT